ncbi:MAG: hypothetical protein CMJ84_10820 [Planctomycetes bacterium]|nr:hypothetical protein [Planctomycetota bacterium]
MAARFAMSGPSATALTGRPRSGAPRRATLLLGLAACLTVASPGALAQGRLDAVSVRNSRGELQTVTGKVLANSLTEVRVDRGGKERTYDADQVERIVWGEASSHYREGLKYFERGDFQNAADKFAFAADNDGREVVKASARRLAGDAQLRLGHGAPAHLPLAQAEYDRFRSDFGDGRDLPPVLMSQARASLLAGDQAGAAERYRALFERGSGDAPTPGYPRLMCMRAGLAAARAATDTGETLVARELYGALGNAVRALLAEASEGTETHAQLVRLAAGAQLGEGFVLIASGQPNQALPFFNARVPLGSAPSGDAGDPSLRFGTQLGIGEAHLAQRDYSKARVALAGVAALDHTDRDRVARALVRLAACYRNLSTTDSTSQAKRRLTYVVEHYSDTPWARVARETLAADF